MDRSYNPDAYDDPVEHDREISLGTPTVLGIFFGLALVCALFFGLGYSMGRRSAQPVVSTTAEPASETAPASAAAKPPSGLPGDTPVTNTPAEASAPADIAPEPKPRIIPAVVSTPRPAPPIEKPAPTPVAAAVPTTTGTIVVQIAAVSHREDADVLLTTLQRRGYNVAVRQEPQDKLLHIQIGPFATRKDADTMRQRLLADGYNAIVK